MKEHAVIYTYWDNLGEGWRMECACGFCTIPAGSLQTAAEDMDDHLSDVGADKRGGGAAA